MNQRIKIGSAVMLCLVLIFIQVAPSYAAPMSAYAAPIPIRIGDSGPVVRSMQTKLKQWNYYSDAVDGVFGSETQKAVILFQRKNGVTPDGIVGQDTADKMGLRLAQSNDQGYTPGGGNNEGDVYLLAKAIFAEARGEPYTGMVAVGAVILNRVESAKFPNSIAGVIYQPGAFTAVSDGQINLTPDSQSVQAARDAMNGWDPSGGALYYYNPAKTTSTWIYSRQVITVIGRHRFAL